MTAKETSRKEHNSQLSEVLELRLTAALAAKVERESFSLH